MGSRCSRHLGKLERKLKNRKNAPRLCPVCNGMGVLLEHSA